MKPGFENVIIVGAGPSGLLLGLLLAKHNIPTHILDAAAELDTQPRAAHYGPPAIPELQRAGILKEVREKGLTLNDMCWRKMDTTELGGLDASVLVDENGKGTVQAKGLEEGLDIRTASLALQDLLKILLCEFEKSPVAKIEFNAKVVDLGEANGQAWVDVETEKAGGNDENKKRRRLQASYVIGCDGANSVVRKSLFADRPDKGFPGFTWEQQIVATNTYYDFRKFGYKDANFIIHPQHLYMAAIIDSSGLWRVTYGEEPGLTHEQLLERQPWKFETILPGNPKPDEYKIVNFSPYKMHQRLAESMRKGKFMLAADAAHLCNPFGGLGITGGFVDVGGLFDCLVGIWEGKADEGILDVYSEVRRRKYQEVIDPVSTDNFKRLWGQDPEEAAEKDEFLKICRKAEKDRGFMKELMLGSMGIRYDFTQHYNKTKEEATSEETKTGASVSHIEVAPMIGE